MARHEWEMGEAIGGLRSNARSMHYRVKKIERAVTKLDDRITAWEALGRKVLLAVLAIAAVTFNLLPAKIAETILSIILKIV